MNAETPTPEGSELASAAAENVSLSAEANTIIRARGLTRTFDMGERRLEVLKTLDFSLFDRDFVAVSGPSGAGKSTLLHLLGLLDVPDAGEISYEGKVISKLSRERQAIVRNQEFGFVFQFFHLLPEFNALENVVLPARIGSGGFEWLKHAGAITERARELLDQMGLGQRTKHHPTQLSGGERQRVAIARALINQPKVVFCDEPTGNLDSATAEEVMKLLLRLNEKQGQAFMIVTHDDEIAAQAHRQLAMRDGQFIYEPHTLSRQGRERSQ